MPASKKPATSTKKAKPKKNPIVIYPDSWAIEDGEKSSFLVFYKEDTPIMKMELNIETTAPLLEELNNMFILESDVADSWTYRSPVEGSKDYLTLLKNGKSMGTLPVDKNVGFKLLVHLGKFKPKVDARENLKKWASKHKIQAVLLGVILLVGLGYPLLSMVVDFVEGLI